MSDKVLLPVLITGIASKIDGSIKVTLETRELNSKDAASLFALRNLEAWAVLAPNEITEVNLPTEKADPSLGTKTPSQRLRNVLYVYWQQNKNGDFESYYRTQIERIIEQLKERLV
jgi:hypothetical protein